MNKFKIIILALVLMPTLALAQTDKDIFNTNDLEGDSRTADSATTDTIRTTDSNLTDSDITKDAEPTTDVDTTADADSELKTNTDDSDQDLRDLQTITDSYSQIEEEAKLTESELRSEIKKAIDQSILNIRSQEDIEAYELQRTIDDTRNTIYQDINATLNDSSLTDTDSIDQLGDRVGQAVDDIESQLEAESGVELDLSDNRVNITDTILRYQTIIEEKRQILEEREANLIEQDTDEDGLSDYDEKYIYKTDPENAYTVEGELNDAQKIEAGINPTSPEQAPIEYQDPREDRKSVISKIHKVKRVELVNVDGVVGKRLKLEGSALPNSFVTLYVFSTPTIVTIKTDKRGEWSYTLDKELENGEHEVYVATVDNTGRLLARSEGVPVTQTAEAAALGTFGIGEPEEAPRDFVQENFILIVLAILLFAIVIVLILSGSKKKDEDFLDVPRQNSEPETPQPEDSEEQNSNENQNT